MKALAHILIEKKNPTCPKTLTTENHVFYTKKKATLSIVSIQCEERYTM